MAHILAFPLVVLGPDRCIFRSVLHVSSRFKLLDNFELFSFCSKTGFLFHVITKNALKNTEILPKE